MQEYNVTIKENGRIVIPAAFRKELNINIGDEVILSISDEKDIIIHSPKQSLQKLQTLFTKNSEDSLVNELIEMRKKEEI